MAEKLQLVATSQEARDVAHVKRLIQVQQDKHMIDHPGRVIVCLEKSPLSA